MQKCSQQKDNRGQSTWGRNTVSEKYNQAVGKSEQRKLNG